MSEEKRQTNKLRKTIQGRIKSSLSGFLRAFVVAMLVLLQFLILILLPFILSSYTIYIYAILELLSLIIIISLVNDNKSPSYKISWICIALILPFTGQIMYALWGKSTSKKKIEERVLAKFRHGFSFLKQEDGIIEQFIEKYPSKARMPKYMRSEGFPLFKNNNLEYFPMAEDAFADMFDELEKAEKFILINFYIVAEGGLWDHFHEILTRKIKEGVEVLFLYDDFGAMLRTQKGFRHSLEEEGFQIRVFNPIHKYTDKLYMNYRSHEKILVVDGNIGYTGGFNLADEYANLINRFGEWKDNGIKVVGDAVWGLTVTFFQMWEASGSGNFINYDKYRPTAKFEQNDGFCQVISDGPANNPNNPIENVYQQMISYSNEFLYITTPYLIIEDNMKELLVVAAKSGVDVRIITPYIPDKKNVKYLTNYNYGYLLQNGVRIYEYKPGFIHAKTIINEDSAIVGTINMDYRSFYLQYECGVFMAEEKIVDTIKKDLLSTMDECVEVTYEEWKNRPLWLKARQSVLNMFSTLM
ncbi:cardiolipin synthetase [Lachnospiraceae bacterium KM106-2]|nr:cardiolipin synthetase [Lachnospiraceae bacterium KM106-2]